jgi:hypothetical protein
MAFAIKNGWQIDSDQEITGVKTASDGSSNVHLLSEGAIVTLIAGTTAYIDYGTKAVDFEWDLASKNAKVIVTADIDIYYINPANGLEGILHIQPTGADRTITLDNKLGDTVYNLFIDANAPATANPNELLLTSNTHYILAFTVDDDSIWINIASYIAFD